jgi:isoquinoline 1-oxidoreductase beta subunit
MPLFTRRGFLLTGAALGGTALVAAVAGVGYLATVDVDGLDGRIDGDHAILNAFITINPDGTIVIFVPKTEMGQGIHTGLAMVVAEELDLPLDERIRVEFPSEAHPAFSNWFNALQQRPEEAGGPVVWLARRIFGQMGFVATGASGSTMGMWHPMRLAGAAARHMLVAAAANQLGVPVTELTTRDGFVYHEATGQLLSYGELARAATLFAAAGYARPEAPVGMAADRQIAAKGRSARKGARRAGLWHRRGLARHAVRRDPPSARLRRAASGAAQRGRDPCRAWGY